MLAGESENVASEAFGAIEPHPLSGAIEQVTTTRPGRVRAWSSRLKHILDEALSEQTSNEQLDTLQRSGAKLEAGKRGWPYTPARRWREPKPPGS